MVEDVRNKDGTFDIKGLDKVELVYTEIAIADLMMRIHRESPESKYEQMMIRMDMDIRKGLDDFNDDITDFGMNIVRYMGEILDGESVYSDVTVDELAGKFDVSQKSAIGGLTKLITAGYVYTDKGLVHLTEKGWKYVEFMRD